MQMYYLAMLQFNIDVIIFKVLSKYSMGIHCIKKYFAIIIDAYTLNLEIFV